MSGLDDSDDEDHDEAPYKITQQKAPLAVLGEHCTWTGITCRDGKVVRFELNVRDLTGKIPPELGDLESLERLYLYGNQLS